MEDNSQSDTQYIPIKRLLEKEQQNIIRKIKKK